MTLTQLWVLKMERKVTKYSVTNSCNDHVYNRYNFRGLLEEDTRKISKVVFEYIYLSYIIMFYNSNEFEYFEPMIQDSDGMNVMQTSARERVNTQLRTMFYTCITLEGILEAINFKNSC